MSFQGLSDGGLLKGANQRERVFKEWGHNREGAHIYRETSQSRGPLGDGFIREGSILEREVY